MTLPSNRDFESQIVVLGDVVICKTKRKSSKRRHYLLAHKIPERVDVVHRDDAHRHANLACRNIVPEQTYRRVRGEQSDKQRDHCSSIQEQSHSVRIHREPPILFLWVTKDGPREEPDGTEPVCKWREQIPQIERRVIGISLSDERSQLATLGYLGWHRQPHSSGTQLHVLTCTLGGLVVRAAALNTTFLQQRKPAACKSHCAPCVRVTVYRWS